MQSRFSLWLVQVPVERLQWWTNRQSSTLDIAGVLWNFFLPSNIVGIFSSLVCSSVCSSSVFLSSLSYLPPLFWLFLFALIAAFTLPKMAVYSSGLWDTNFVDHISLSYQTSPFRCADFVSQYPFASESSSYNGSFMSSMSFVFCSFKLHVCKQSLICSLFQFSLCWQFTFIFQSVCLKDHFPELSFPSPRSLLTCLSLVWSGRVAVDDSFHVVLSMATTITNFLMLLTITDIVSSMIQQDILLRSLHFTAFYSQCSPNLLRIFWFMFHIPLLPLHRLSLFFSWCWY